MPAALSRGTPDHRLEGSVRDAACCEAVVPCADCQARLAEVRAARRDALIHAVARVRPRRERR